MSRPLKEVRCCTLTVQAPPAWTPACAGEPAAASGMTYDVRRRLAAFDPLRTLGRHHKTCLMQHDEQPEEPVVGDFESMLEWFTGNGQEHRAYQAIEKGDYEKARRLLEPAADRNSVYSLLTLGGFYEAGKLGPPDPGLALSYYRRAADQGSAGANRRLGRLLLDQGNEKEARAAFEPGAEAGNISCMFWLGKMMLDGRGGVINVGRGTEWLERAAAQGHLFAKRALLGLASRNSKSIFKRSLVLLQIVLLALNVGKATWKSPDADILN